MSDACVIHFRCREGGKILTKGGVTVAVRRRADDELEAAYSICSARDGFDPRKGMKRAMARLTSQPKNGRQNSRLVSTSNLQMLDAVAEIPGELCEEYDALEELLREKPNMVIAFAWDVAVNRVMRMTGGTAEDRQRLQTTLSSAPRVKKPA